ncbi:MAG: glycerol kinase GlpK [Christensenella sp.]|uniref:glycerol kinase GlpK n=1 Tax=Christensenella sp. TaxID=1935934 RepID=UPI002B20F4F1|nr:glycerol kinase GlpK [Christensenella sp.]MEA5004646.1 glycerol kinase GlpK [Christensenella sp.]
MSKKYYLGIDQGTTGTTALLLDEEWNQVGRGYKEHTQYYPQPGWVEHDAMEIWDRLRESVEMGLGDAGITMDDIKCMGLDNQGETVVLWDNVTGKPVYRAIVWQDRRTARDADEIKAGYGDMIREKTGLVVDAYFSATKIKWIIDNVPGVQKDIERHRINAGTLDSWMIWKLTHGRVFVTDQSTASRTMLFNIHTGQWDDEILEILGIPKDILPEICDSAQVYGETDPLDFFGGRVKISGSTVDQQAALFGQACFTPGMVKTTYGTGAFMLMNTGSSPVYSQNGLLTTVGWGLDDHQMTFALDGGIYIAGAAVQWLRDKLKIIADAAETEAMAKAVEDTGGVYFVPAFAGLAAPHWDQYARGTIIGITGGTTREQLVRATLESEAYQVKDNLDVMERDSGIPIEVMRVDGGAVANEFLMQFQADILGIPVDVPVITETTALGAAYLAAYGIGDYESLEDLSSNWKLYKRYEPNMDDATRERLLHHWHKAVERAKDWDEN